MLKKINGGLSALYVKVLECFWGGGELNIQRTGVRIPLGPSYVHLRLTFAFFISDEKAEKEALGVKGAGGSKMCISCQNCAVQGRCGSARWLHGALHLPGHDPVLAPHC